jgi:DNA-3-methyladenine glycosylase
MPNILTQAYFTRPTLIVARSLIGKYLIRENGRGTIVGKIVEVEAYVGAEDKACHASKGRTARTEVLFGPPGISYVYLIYGMYHMLNVVTERADFPAAVLIRAIDVNGELIDGPGKLCRELGIDRSLHQVDLTEGRSIWFEDRGQRVPESQIGTFPRIGVEYAGLWARKPWRFRLIEGNGPRSSSPRKHKAKGKSL